MRSIWRTRISCLQIIVLLPAGVGTSGFAQAPDTVWTRTYNEYMEDVGWSVKESAKGYAVAGSNWNERNQSDDIYLMFINYYGIVQWDKYYGDYGYNVARGMDVVGDSGYILTGYTDSGGLFLLRTDVAGGLMWMRTYNEGYAGNCVITTSDGGFVVAGRTYSDLIVIKADSLGEVIWSRIHSNPENSYDEGFSVCETTDMCYAVVGYTEAPSQGEVNVWLLKLSQNGSLLWSRMYGGWTGDGGDWISQTSDGGFIVAGRSASYGDGSWDVLLIKTDASGNVDWFRTYGGSEWDGAHSVQETESGGYFVGAYSESFGNLMDFYFIETDYRGNEIWSGNIGGPGMEWGLCSIITSDGCYLMVGSSWVSDRYGSDIYIVKLRPGRTDAEEIWPAEIQPLTSLKNCPNPFNTKTTLTYTLPRSSRVLISVCNLLGQRVGTLFEGEQQAGSHSLICDARVLPSGVYFARLEAEQYSQSVKMVVLR